jgi:hypothetical protein
MCYPADRIHILLYPPLSRLRGIYYCHLGKVICTVLVLLVVFLTGGVTSVKSPPGDDFSKYNVIIKRNIFNPLWAVNTETIYDKSRKEELEALKKAEEERKEALRKAEEDRKEAQRIADEQKKKREIEENYKLTGIVFEKEKKQAIIQDKKGMSYFVFENDMLGEVKIVSINDAAGEVTADYLGIFTVKFHME